MLIQHVGCTPPYHARVVCVQPEGTGWIPSSPPLLALLELAQLTDSLLTQGTFICPIARGIVDDPAAGGVSPVATASRRMDISSWRQCNTDLSEQIFSIFSTSTPPFHTWYQTCPIQYPHHNFTNMQGCRESTPNLGVRGNIRPALLDPHRLPLFLSPLLKCPSGR